jgi:hypothetical protein
MALQAQVDRTQGRACFATFVIAALVTASIAALELRDLSMVPIVSAEIGWASRSVFDILYGGVLIAGLVDLVEVCRLSRRLPPEPGRPLFAKLIRNTITMLLVLAALGVIELAIVAMCTPTALPLPIALALSAGACGLYQLFGPIRRGERSSPSTWTDKPADCPSAKLTD